MKRLLLILIPFALLVTACSKEKSLEATVDNPDPGGGGGPGGGDSNTSYFIKCKIGGVDKTFDVGASAAKETVNGQTGTLIGGRSTDNPTTYEAFSIIITSSAALANGTYTIDNLSGSYTIAVVYAPSVTSTSILVTGTGMLFGNSFKVNITSVSSTEIAGTFSGNIYEIDENNPNPTNPPAKAVTEGEFKVKFE